MKITQLAAIACFALLTPLTGSARENDDIQWDKHSLIVNGKRVCRHGRNTLFTHPCR